MAQPSGPTGPFCQSCGMPLSTAEDFGTSAVGFRQNDYCRLCYQDGVFFQPDITLGQMIDFCVKPMAENTGMSEEAARGLLQENLPRLKRWHPA